MLGEVMEEKQKDIAVYWVNLSVGTIRLCGFHRHQSLIEQSALYIKYSDTIRSVRETIYETGNIEITDTIAGKTFVLLVDIKPGTGSFHFHLDF